MSKGKSVKKILLGILIIIIIIAVAIFFKIQKFNEAFSEIEVNNIDLSNVDDGVYTGVFDHEKIVGAKVKITVEDNRITNIELVEHNYGLGKKAEAITDIVVDSQSLSVDAISGATCSSKAILKAIENALVSEGK